MLGPEPEAERASWGEREAAELRGIGEGRATRKGAQLAAEQEGEGGV